MTEFDDLIDRDGLDEAEVARLRRVHELLVEAGPPPELPPALLRPPTAPREAEVVEFPLHLRRRVGAWIAVAAAVAGVLFAAGYAFGHAKAKPATFSAVRSVPMHGPNDARGSIRIGDADGVGNVPMVVTISGLPKQAVRGDYYELWLTENGKITKPCGGFRMHGSATTVRLSAPYKLDRGDGWVVTIWKAGHRTPGRVVMTT